MSGRTVAVALAVWLGQSAATSVISQGSPQPSQDAVLTAIARAAEMPALAAGDLPADYRELRMRAEQPMVCCDARPMLRVVQSGTQVTGSLWLFRTLVLRPGNPAPRDDERCEPLGEQHICVRRWNLVRGDWSTVAAKLEELHAWTLSEPCNRPAVGNYADGSVAGGSVSVVLDAGLLSVERLIGPNLTNFTCIGPGSEREADGIRANEQYKYLLTINGPIPSEPLRMAR